MIDYLDFRLPILVFTAELTVQVVAYETKIRKGCETTELRWNTACEVWWGNNATNETRV